jgi:formylmethanofuran dehydrogenase subunit E
MNLSFLCVGSLLIHLSQYSAPLHHSSVNVISRDSEDGPGISALSDENGIHVKRVDAEQIYGRRDVIEIEFWCESCGENAPKKRLRINQHKGNTLIQWA